MAETNAKEIKMKIGISVENYCTGDGSYTKSFTTVCAAGEMHRGKQPCPVKDKAKDEHAYMTCHIPDCANDKYTVNFRYANAKGELSELAPLKAKADEYEAACKSCPYYRGTGLTK
ncbi:MAG: hypothetical protein LBQ49_01350 [Rickettsiales bacterium]|jgi:hypothetical protein|nr:hypothetical protein [Rickettsiales bacterium]